MAGHSKRSPSSAKANMACAGRLALIDALPGYQKNVGGDAARMGTCAHWLIEHCLANDAEPKDFAWRVIAILHEGEDNETVKMLAKSAKTPSNTPWYEVDDDMIAGATLMTQYVRDRMAEFAELGHDVTLQLESRTNPLPERDDTSGTADVTIVARLFIKGEKGGTLEVVDYKNGYNVVEHIDNEQLLAYLLGKAIDYKWAFSHYQITVVQPNAQHEEGTIRPFVATKAELLAFQARYRAGMLTMEKAEADARAPDDINAASEVDSKWAAKWLKSGDHCMFCDAKAVCPAYINRAADQASMDFMEDPQEMALVKPSSTLDVAKILRWKPYFDALFKAAYLYGARAAENGFEVEGFKQVRTKPHRRFINKPEAELARLILKKYPDLTREQIFNDKLKTGPQIEKLLPKAKRDTFAGLFMYQPEGELTLVPVEDARNEVLTHAADDFEADDFDGEDLDFG